MSKTEQKKKIYEQLEALGRKPEKHYRFCKLEDLETELAEAMSSVQTHGDPVGETGVQGETGSIGADGINLDDLEAVYDFLSENTELELNPIDEYTRDELIEMFNEQFKGKDGKDQESDKSDEETKAGTPEEAKKAEKPAVIPTLNFKSSGWCEALGKSYFRGVHKCSSVEEYEALKEFAETK